MVVKIQSPLGHTTLPDLIDAEVDAKFAELTEQGFRAFADTKLADPVGPLKTVEDARRLGAEELLFVGPLAGG